MNKEDVKTRRLAWEIIKKATKRDRRLSDVTAEIYKREGTFINDQERRFITILVQGTVRLSGRLDWELGQVFVGEYNSLKENLRILLRLGAFQLNYMDSVPDYAAVSTTVQLAKRIHNNLGGLTNALLRALIKIEEVHVPDENSPIDIISNYLSHPEWLINKWIKDTNFKQTKALAEWNNQYPQLWFRVNSLVFTPSKFIQYLNDHAVEYEQFRSLPNYFKTDQHQKIIKSNIFKDGKISVQDPSAGLVVQLVDPQKEEMIIDSCAAPGGKSSYMAEIMNNTGSILSLDSNEDRLKRLDINISRLHITNTKTDLIDITKEKSPYDR